MTALFLRWQRRRGTKQAEREKEGLLGWQQPQGVLSWGKGLARTPTPEGLQSWLHPKRSEILERQLSSEIFNLCITLCLLSLGTLGLSSSHHTTIILCLALTAERGHIISAAQFLLWMFLFWEYQTAVKTARGIFVSQPLLTPQNFTSPPQPFKYLPSMSTLHRTNTSYPYAGLFAYRRG